jgi:hypothetical protein
VCAPLGRLTVQKEELLLQGATMFSADSVHNAFMKSTQRERVAFERAAAAEKAAEEKRRGKPSNYFRREWGASIPHSFLFLFPRARTRSLSLPSSAPYSDCQG